MFTQPVKRNWTELTDAILLEQKVNCWPPNYGARVIFKMAGHMKKTSLKRVVYTVAFYKERQNKQNNQVQILKITLNSCVFKCQIQDPCNEKGNKC